jgi:predicted nucleic acid-binding protein
MSDLVIFDTSIFIDDFRSGRHQQRIAALSGRIRTSSVVLAELWRGATKASEQDLVRNVEKSRDILTPTENNWLESGLILARMKRAHGFSPEKIRGLHFDVLIALTARSHGARLVTSNGRDFEMIRYYREFQLEIW